LTKPEPGKKTPPPVSSSEMKRRFRVDLETKVHEINLSHLFSPTLDEASEDESFLEVLVANVISLCSIATIHFEKLKNPSTTAHNVSFVASYLL